MARVRKGRSLCVEHIVVTSNYTPYELEHGQQPQLPHSLSMICIPSEEDRQKSGKDYESFAKEQI